MSRAARARACARRSRSPRHWQSEQRGERERVHTRHRHECAADADARDRHEHARQRRSRDPAEVLARVVERRGIGELGARHQFGDIRLPRGHIEGERGALHEAARNHVPDLQIASYAERRERRGRKTKCRLTGNQHEPPRQAVRGHAADQRQQQHRQALGQADDAQNRRRVGERERRVRAGDLVHHHGQRGRHHPEPQQPEIRAAQSGIEAQQRRRGCSCSPNRGWLEGRCRNGNSVDRYSYCAQPRLSWARHGAGHRSAEPMPVVAYSDNRVQSAAELVQLRSDGYLPESLIAEGITTPFYVLASTNAAGTNFHYRDVDRRRWLKEPSLEPRRRLLRRGSTRICLRCASTRIG